MHIAQGWHKKLSNRSVTVPPNPIVPVHHIYRVISELALIFRGVVSFPSIARIANTETALFFSFRNAHGMINEPSWPKKDSNQVYCICFFVLSAMSKALYTVRPYLWDSLLTLIQVPSGQ